MSAIGIVAERIVRALLPTALDLEHTAFWIVLLLVVALVLVVCYVALERLGDWLATIDPETPLPEDTRPHSVARWRP